MFHSKKIKIISFSLALLLILPLFCGCGTEIVEVN